MMHRTLFEADHEAFRESFRKFLDTEVVPHQYEWETAGIVPRELFTIAGRSGFLGIDIPEEYGGGGGCGTSGSTPSSPKRSRPATSVRWDWG